MMENEKPTLTLEQRVLQYIKRYGLVSDRQKVLVAVSGGPDSTCLLHILYHLQKELNISLHVAHLNHQLRGEESDADARYVAELSRKLNISCTIEKRDVKAYQTAQHLSLEEAAREVRYRFLAETAKQVGTERAVVGHTRNDQVETILLHIIRGTGTKGLCGLQPCVNLEFSGYHLTLVRPLLEIERGEIEEYCACQHLEPRRDASNLSLNPLRNRVRGELLPLLQSYNPGIKDSILRISRISRDEQAFLDVESASAWENIVSKKTQTLLFDKTLFRRLLPALQRQIIRRAFEELLGTLKDIETRHVEQVLSALAKPAGRQISLPGGLVFSIEYNRYLLSKNTEEVTPFAALEGIYKIKIPGTTEIPGWNIETSVKTCQSVVDELKELVEWGNDGFLVYLDKERVGSDLEVRPRLPGDWFIPLGMNRPKKVGEFMLDARVPRPWRSKIPLFCTPQQVIWVAGWRIDDRVKITESTQEVLCVKMKRWPEL